MTGHRPEPTRRDGPVPALDLLVATTAPFPQPPDHVLDTLDLLHLVGEHPPADLDEVRDMVRLPRPWDPSSCPVALQIRVWSWLDVVAAWINEQHLWALTRPGIPECWPVHPHIAHDLAAVAFARVTAGYAVTPTPLVDWHQYTLPGFLDRVAERMPDGCVPGRHAPSPRAGRNESFRECRSAGS